MSETDPSAQRPNDPFLDAVPEAERSHYEAMMAATKDWPRLSADVLNELSDEFRLVVRVHEEEMISGNNAQLIDIINNCHIRPQFAKTYLVLRKDKQESLRKLQSKLDSFAIQPDTTDPKEKAAQLLYRAMIRSTDQILTYKLRQMSTHFLIRWNEPIENWAGKEGSTGCVLVLLCFASIGATALWLFD